jgi:hypothetical protein
MKKLLIAVAILALAAGAASAKLMVETPTTEVTGPTRGNTIFWYDDIEGDVSMWSSVDFTAGASPHFHVDTYMAYAGTYSWWCGTFDYDADGGYGNGWDDRLNIPATDVTGSTYPILTYAFRHDSEPAFDFTYVQAESNGVYVNLNRGYDGAAAWSDIGVFGFVMAPYDNPIKARFRFVSDGAWSDQDGLYLSNGGAFMVDNIKIFDYFTGTEYFFDDVEDGVGLCQPAVPASAGDWWHIVDRKCPAYSDPHTWWCGDDADTSLIPPNLDNGLFTPVVSIPTDAVSCTVRFALHTEVPTVDNDYYVYYATVDGGLSYAGLAAYWGDFGQCDGWSSSGFGGYALEGLGAPPWTVGFMWEFFTTDNGCGPGAAGGAGLFIDDTWFEGYVPPTAVEEASWGKIKSMYR